MDKITTTIKREWLKEIAGRRKRVEYREIKPYWDRRLSLVKVPFELRLINGMDLKAPELPSGTRACPCRIGEGGRGAPLGSLPSRSTDIRLQLGSRRFLGRK